MFLKINILLSITFLLLQLPASGNNGCGIIISENTISHTSPSGKSKSNTITWNKYRKLKITDFQARRSRSNKNTAATTASAFGFNITDKNGQITGNIFVKFYKEDSWWNPENENSRRKQIILKHEQLHFDICELFGRKLYREILKLKSKNHLNSRSLDRLHKRLEKEYHHYQDLYDKETDHSLNAEAQKKWNSKVDKELRSLDKYSNYHSF